MKFCWEFKKNLIPEYLFPFEPGEAAFHLASPRTVIQAQRS